MLHEPLRACAIAGLVSSTAYLAMAAEASRRFARLSRARRPAARPQLPPVSVLKPLRGGEPRLEECLETFFRQDYPRYELVFGARDAADPAWDVVHALQRRYPDVICRNVVCGEPAYANAKVSALETMGAAASGCCLVIADSDTRVRPDTLGVVVAPLRDPHVGLVTCLYRGVPSGGLASRLDALGMSVDVPSGVLVARMLEGMRFALGALIAVRRDVLDAIGGFQALGAYCADDFVLGRLVHDAGKAVVLSEHVVDHIASDVTLAGTMRHQVRWMRSTRCSRPKGHVGTVLTFAMPFGLLGLAVAVSRGRVAAGAGLACWAVANRVVQCVLVGGMALRDPACVRWCWLYPLRDLAGFGAWCASFLGRVVVWRGERYRLTTDGRMRRVGAVASALS